MGRRNGFSSVCEAGFYLLGNNLRSHSLRSQTMFGLCVVSGVPLNILFYYSLLFCTIHFRFHIICIILYYHFLNCFIFYDLATNATKPKSF